MEAALCAKHLLLRKISGWWRRLADTRALSEVGYYVVFIFLIPGQARGRILFQRWRRKRKREKGS